MNKLGEVNSEEWNKIKGWMGGANGKKDHPLVQEAKRAQRVQKFDEGGEVGLDDETLKFLQPQGAGLIAPSAAQSQPQMPAPVQAPVQAPLQPPTTQMPPQPIGPPVAPIQSPSSDSQANSILGTNPQELEAFLQKVNQPNWRQQVGAGVTGLADAFSRAGGSNSDYERQYNERVQQGKQNMSAIPEKVAGLGKEKFGLTQTLDAQNPDSQYSKINQATYGPDLLKMGLTAQQISKMPASLIGDLLGKKITLEEAKARIGETAAFHEATNLNARIGLEQAGRHQENEDTDKAIARQTEKDKAIAGGSVIPFVGPSHSEKQSAFHRLAGDNDFDHTSIPPGTIYKAPDGTMRRKS